MTDDIGGGGRPPERGGSDYGSDLGREFGDEPPPAYRDAWFCPEPRWAAEMVPHVIDVLQLPGRCAGVAPGGAAPGWFLIRGQPPVAVPALP